MTIKIIRVFTVAETETRHADFIITNDGAISERNGQSAHTDAICANGRIVDLPVLCQWGEVGGLTSL